MRVTLSGNFVNRNLRVGCGILFAIFSVTLGTANITPAMPNQRQRVINSRTALSLEAENVGAVGERVITVQNVVSPLSVDVDRAENVQVIGRYVRAGTVRLHLSRMTDGGAELRLRDASGKIGAISVPARMCHWPPTVFELLSPIGAPADLRLGKGYAAHIEISQRESRPAVGKSPITVYFAASVRYRHEEGSWQLRFFDRHGGSYLGSTLVPIPFSELPVSVAGPTSTSGDESYYYKADIGDLIPGTRYAVQLIQYPSRVCSGDVTGVVKI